MRNLLNSTEIATIFVDNEMRVRRFTTEATTIVNLIPSDIGRPLQHVMNNLSYDAMMTDLSEVLKKLTHKQIEVQTVTGQWYKMRILPYRTTDNRIAGAVLTFSAIDEQKKSQEVLQTTIREMEHTRELVRAVFDMNTDPMAVLDADCKMLIANTALSELLNITQEDVKGTELLCFDPRIPQKLDLESKLKTAMEQGTDFKTQAFEIELPEGKQQFTIQGRVVKKDEDFPYRILLQFVRQS
jgi:two-component system CheB/CheR fusion protein